MKPIRMRVAGGVFTVRLWPTLMTAVMSVVLIGLGTWQLERLHWKTDLLDTIDQRIHETPVDVAGIIDPAANEYRPVQATGLLQHDKELYLNSISLTGEGGYHILTPLQMEDGHTLLVDRGWVPYDKKLPAGRLDGQLFGPVTVRGIMRIPHRHWMQPASNPDKNEWSGIDLAAMAKADNIPEFLPFIVEADAAKNPGGYPVGGQTRVTMPNNHLSYAITWYGLALSLLVIYGVSGFRKVS